MNKTKNPNRLKGVVLYTVVGVMMVLLLFVMSALALAANANKIALQDYARTQTQYTARSVVESVVQQLTDKSNTSLGQSILGMSAGNKITLNMVDDTGTVNNTLPDGMGTVKSIEIEYVGKDELGTKYYVAGTGKTIVRISAEVELAGKTSTFSQYLLNEYRAKLVTPATPDAGFISLGGFGGSNNPHFYGDAYFNIDNIDDPTTGSYQVRNDGILTGNLYFNKSLQFNANPTFQWGAGNGLVVQGNLERSDNMYEFKSIAGTSIDYLDIPYLYVTGTLNQGKKNIGTPTDPINIYCGTYKSERDEQPSIYGDVYVYDAGGTSTLGGSKPTKLMNWANTVVNNLNGTNSLGGNFFTKGSLNIQGSNESFILQGDIIVNKNLNIQNIKNGTNYIDGTVIVGGSLNINSWDDKDIQIKGGIYCDPTAINVTGNAKINGVKYSDYGDGKKLEFLQAVNKRADKSPFHDATGNPENRLALGTSVTFQSIGRTVTFEEPSADTNVWDGTAYVPYSTLKATKEALEANTARTEAEEQQLKDVSKYMYDAQYQKFIGAVKRNTKTDNTTTYEDYMTGLGYTKDEVTANINNVEVLFPPKMEIPDIENNVVPSQSSIQNKFFTTGVDGTKQLIGMVYENTNGISTIYKKGNNQNYLVGIGEADNMPHEIPGGHYTTKVGDTEANAISTSCTIVLTGGDQKIYINPGTNEIWINLVTQSEWDTARGEIIIDTSQGGKVNFFVPKAGEKFQYKDVWNNNREITASGNISFENIKIMTKKYYNAWRNHEQLNLAKYVADYDPELVPNVYFYMPGTGKLSFRNNCMFTGYIYAPNAEFRFDNGIGNFDNKVDYGYYDITKSPMEYYKTSDVTQSIGIIGSLIVGEAKDITNQFALVHVTPEKTPAGSGGSGGSGGGATEVNNWTAIQFGAYSNV